MSTTLHQALTFLFPPEFLCTPIVAPYSLSSSTGKKRKCTRVIKFSSIVLKPSRIPAPCGPIFKQPKNTTPPRVNQVQVNKSSCHSSPSLSQVLCPKVAGKFSRGTDVSWPAHFSTFKFSPTASLGPVTSWLEVSPNTPPCSLSSRSQNGDGGFSSGWVRARR